MAQPVDQNRGERLAAGGERIAKLLARAGVASRREIERMIADGRIARDGVAIDTPATVLPSLDGVTVDGHPVAAAEAARLFLYHKPPGLLVTERDPRGRPTIYERLPSDLPRVVPVGRLDLATEGLLLLTTDGELKRQLELPATGVERTYRARVYGPVTQPLLETLIDGIEIDGFRYGPIDANLERRTGANSWIELTLTEGKNREVRRVLEYLGLEVSRLLRTRYGPFVLGDLPAGAVGEVRQKDLVAFRQTLGAKGKNDTRITVPAGGSERSTAKPRPASNRSTPAHGYDLKVVTAAPQAQRSARPDSRRVTASGARAPAGLAPSGKPFKWRNAPPASGAPPSASATRSAKVDSRDGPTRDGADVSPRSPRKSSVDRPRVAAPTAPRPAVPAADPPPTRPAKPQRKAGWAKPKPKSGPSRRPGKSR